MSVICHRAQHGDVGPLSLQGATLIMLGGKLHVHDPGALQPRNEARC